jgi:hypothetical protein
VGHPKPHRSFLKLASKLSICPSHASASRSFRNLAIGRGWDGCFLVVRPEHTGSRGAPGTAGIGDPSGLPVKVQVGPSARRTVVLDAPTTLLNALFLHQLSELAARLQMAAGTEDSGALDPASSSGSGHSEPRWNASTPDGAAWPPTHNRSGAPNAA